MVRYCLSSISFSCLVFNSFIQDIYSCLMNGACVCMERERKIGLVIKIFY
jgi:hypothetical protein